MRAVLMVLPQLKESLELFVMYGEFLSDSWGSYLVATMTQAVESKVKTNSLLSFFYHMSTIWILMILSGSKTIAS